MANLSSLTDRIDAEFAAATQNVAETQKQRVQQFQEKQQRLEAMEKKLDELRDVWRPRLEALAKRFADKVKVTPTVSAGSRLATFQFQSELARIDLQFSVLSDEDARNVTFKYDLSILPIFMKFDSHDEVQFPLANIDRDKLGAWIDDRIISFVRTYLELHQNNYYLQEHLVEDPIAKVKFPKYAAGAKLDSKGKTVYFISEETRQQYEKQQSATGGK
jgi:YHS domain-containing protein